MLNGVSSTKLRTCGNVALATAHTCVASCDASEAQVTTLCLLHSYACTSHPFLLRAAVYLYDLAHHAQPTGVEVVCLLLCDAGKGETLQDRRRDRRAKATPMSPAKAQSLVLAIVMVAMFLRIKRA